MYASVVYVFVAAVREPGGLSMVQALEIVRGCRGLNLVGADMVEVGGVLKPYALALGGF